MQRYTWPGNVRELRTVVERAMILCRGSTLSFDIPHDFYARPDHIQLMSLQSLEKKHIEQALQASGWRVRGRHGAAEILGLKPTTLDSKIKKLGIKRHP